MDEKRLVMIGVGAVLAVSTITLLAVTMSGGDGGDEDVSDKLNKTNPVLLISLDGFRSDYIFRQLPTLETLAKNGVTARYMVPSYPTITFPNHYTIVTGLYPESHGIVANYFYDPTYKAIFSMGVKDGKWWGGEPIWNTLTRQNKTSATFFWPGSDCDINGERPTFWEPFDETIPFETRVDQVVEWLSMPEDTRPDWVSLYFEEPDSSGHEFGPDTDQVRDKLIYVDGMIGRLLSGLRHNNMEDKVNIIVLADHGMAKAGSNKHINLTKYVPDIDKTTSNNSYGAFTMLRLNKPNDAAVNNMLKALSCPAEAPYMRAFTPRDLPTRFHYSNNSRIGDIVLDFDSGYYTSKDGYIENGEHGYDNHLVYMHALFIASGPDFQSEVILEPFQNIEIYNLLCYLTGVDPAPNNGTEGSLYAALLDPPPTPEGPTEDTLETPPYPKTLTNEILTMAKCPAGDLATAEEYEEQVVININETEKDSLVNYHLPWGIPSSAGNQSVEDVILLPHKDHVTGYSEKLKMPLWTSFTVSDIPKGTTMNSSLWLTDVRLSPTTTPTCDSYVNAEVNGRSVHMYPLFPPSFSVSESLPRIPFLVSNAVPMYTTARTVDYLAPFLAPDQMKSHAPFNIMLGPVFDNDADSLPDSITDFRTLHVPSDIFVVVTRCTQSDLPSLNDCIEENLDAISFIVPVNEQENVNNNCENDPNYLAMFLATVHDLELATGLAFFPGLDSSARLQLILRIKMNLWHINV